MTQSQPLRVSETHGVFCDAVLVDDNSRLTFGSFWGRDTGIQELMARMTLGPSDADSIDTLHLEGEQTIEVLVGDSRRLDKLNGRVSGTVFDELVHIFLYDQQVLSPDLANRKAIVLAHDQQASSDRLWATARELAAVPLLEEWREVLMPVFFEREWIRSRRGLNVQGSWLHFPDDDLDDLITGLVRSDTLQIAA